jgi:hypothetical protein
MDEFRKEPQMSAKGIVQSVIDEVKSVLAEAEGLLSGEVSPGRAEEVGRALTEAVSAGWVAGFRTWLEQHDAPEETIQRQGLVYRYKLDSEKEFLTPGGPLTLRRRVYQPDAGGKCFIPLDAAWGMEGEFASVEVRDAVLFSVALSTAQETEALLKKCALFHPSETAIKTMAKEMGTWLEEREDQVLAEIRTEESLPEETRVLCASLDGVNVLGREGEETGPPPGASEGLCRDTGLGDQLQERHGGNRVAVWGGLGRQILSAAVPDALRGADAGRGCADIEGQVRARIDGYRTSAR